MPASISQRARRGADCVTQSGGVYSETPERQEADDEAVYLEQHGPDSELVQIVATNGRYAKLALTNWTHFSEGSLNFKTFAKLHTDALKLVVQQGKEKSAGHPIPAKAVFRTSFGCHFLTNGFSASHMRVPRQRLCPFSAKLMHDVDGLVGLWVYSWPGDVVDNSVI
jgi:hypothetical protein